MQFKKLTAVFTTVLFLLCSINILPMQEKLYPNTLEATALSFSEYADQVVALVNQERAKQGLSPLYCSDTLNEVSQMRAEELETYYSHTRPDGSICSTALDGVISYMDYAENIAKTQNSPEEAMDSWMSSDGHRANILDSAFEYIGVGVHRGSNGKYYWVQTFTSGSDLQDTYLPELKDPDTDPDPEPVPYEGTVRFSYSGLNLKKNDKLDLHIAGDPGDVVQIYFYYTDEEGNQQANIIGAFGWTTLDANGRLTESFTAPCDVDYLYGKVVYEKSEPELSYSLEKQSGIEIAIDQKIITLDELKANDYKVPVYVRLNEEHPGINAVEFGLSVDDRCSYTIITNPRTAMELGDEMVNLSMTYIKDIYKANDTDVTWFLWASGDDDTWATTCCLVMVEVPEDVSTGDVFPIYYHSWATHKEDPSYVRPHLWKARDGADYVASGLVNWTDGYIHVDNSAETIATTTTTTTTTEASTSTTTTTTIPEESGLLISESEITLRPGEQYQIQANQSNLTYESSDKEIAIVSKSGVITAMNPGTARITVYNSDYDAVVISVTVTEEVQAILRGDANGDNEVNISDVVLMNRVYVGVDRISEQGLANADTDGDSKITLTDSMNVLRYLVHLIDEL